MYKLFSNIKFVEESIKTLGTLAAELMQQPNIVLLLSPP